MAISPQLLLRVASSNLVGRKSKWYFIIKFSLLLSIVLCWREIRSYASAKLQTYSFDRMQNLSFGSFVNICISRLLVTTDVRQPWTNYVNNGNKHLIVGADVRSEYSNIRYLHLIIGKAQNFV